MSVIHLWIRKQDGVEHLCGTPCTNHFDCCTSAGALIDPGNNCCATCVTEWRAGLVEAALRGKFVPRAHIPAGSSAINNPASNAEAYLPLCQHHTKGVGWRHGDGWAIITSAEKCQFAQGGLTLCDECFSLFKSPKGLREQLIGRAGL